MDKVPDECRGCVTSCTSLRPSIVVNNKKIECPCRTCLVRGMCTEGIRTCEDILIYARNFKRSFMTDDYKENSELEKLMWEVFSDEKYE